jgi:hypothetical protein
MRFSNAPETITLNRIGETTAQQSFDWRGAADAALLRSCFDFEAYYLMSEMGQKDENPLAAGAKRGSFGIEL